VAGFIDTALAGLEVALADEADLVWAGGFRYASFLDDPRPLGLLLEDIAYRVLLTEVSVGGGARTGHILLVLPAVGRGVRPRAALHAVPEAVASHAFAADLAEQIEGAPCALDAVIHRLQCPLSSVIALQVGDVLPLGMASVDKIGFEGLDGQRVAEGRLGQNSGMRAVRLALRPQVAAPQTQASDAIIDLQRVAAAG
jgi:flagellar motor switch protein FliM